METTQIYTHSQIQATAIFRIKPEQGVVVCATEVVVHVVVSIQVMYMYRDACQK